MISRGKLLARGVIFVLISALALAQGGATGAIQGTIQDSTGAVVPNAKVETVNATTGQLIRAETTNSSGTFNATLLPAGTYSIRVSAAGFAPVTVQNIVVRITETTKITVGLKLETAQEKVEVSAQVETVKTTDATTGESIEGRTIQELPLATRNFQQLLALSSGASSQLNAAAQLGRGDVRINVNGGREDNNNYQIEGIGANDPTNAGELANTPLPSPDSIQEFKVSTSLYDATQGRNGGGNINAVLKTGTPELHFDLFEYFRNTVLNANDFFLKNQGLARPDIKQNIFGGSVGGPVGKKGKLGYFFVNYQGTRQRSGDSPGTIISTMIPYVPAADRTSLTALANDFGLDPASIDPMIVKLLAFKSNQFGPNAGGYLYPMPTVAPGTAAGTLVPFRVSKPGLFDDDQFTANWDRDFRGGKDHLAERFFFSNAETDEPFGGDSFQLQTGGSPLESNLNFPMKIPVRDRFGSLAETHVFNDRLINDFRFGASIISYRFKTVPVITTDQLGINRPTNNISSDIYRFFFPSSGFQFGPYVSTPQTTLSDTLSFNDTLSYTRGSHALRFGEEITRTSVRRNLPIADNGFIFFLPGAAPDGSQPDPAFSDFQNFLVGNVAPGSLAFSGLTKHDYGVNSFAFFVQDDYRATSTLNLNLGLRTEILGANYDKLCHLGNVDPALANSTGQPFFYPTCINQFNLPGIQGTVQSSGMENTYTTVLEPRIGLAYDLLGHHTTSIRAGYGIYSIREDDGPMTNMSLTPPISPGVAPFGVSPYGLANMLAQGPFQLPAAGVLDHNFIPQASLFQGFSASGACNGDWTNDTTATPCFSGNVFGFFAPSIPRRWIAPTMQQWNLSVQRTLAKGWTLEVGYVGTKGTHLREVSDANQARLASPQQPITLKVKDPNSPNYGQTYTITQNTMANIMARVPYLGLAPFGYEAFNPDSNSHYHGLQLSLVHRLTQGLYLQSAYTFSKSIDDTSSSQVAFDSRLNDQTNGRASRGPSDFDRRHRLVTTFDYALPFFTHQHGLTKRLLGDWEVNGVLTLQSGTPFTVVDGIGGSAYGLSSPNLVTPVFAPGFNCSNAYSAGDVESRLGGYLNPAAFVNAPVVGVDGATGFGTIGRNCFRGPNQKNLDFSLSKVIHLGEHQSLKFTTEFFNLTNTPSFANPSVLDMNSPSLGTISSTVGTPRLIQFALRYSY